MDRAFAESGQLEIIVEEQLGDDSEKSSLFSMSSLRDNVPTINVTYDDDGPFQEEKGETMLMADYHTDVEDLTSDDDQIQITKSDVLEGNYGLLSQDEGLTDNEMFEASDDDEPYVRPVTPLHVDHMFDYGETVDETQDGSSIRQRSKQPIQSQLLSPSKEEDGLTDFEDMAASGDEEEPLAVEEPDLSFFIDESSVQISDAAKELPPSPSPEPQRMVQKVSRKKSRKSTSQRTKRAQNYFLSPRSLSPQLSDITDTEFLPSDSDEDEDGPKKNLKPTLRQRKGLTVAKTIISGGTDIEELSGEEENRKNKKRLRVVPAAKKERKRVDSDSDNDEFVLSSDPEIKTPIPRHYMKYSPMSQLITAMDKSGLQLEVLDGAGVTDIEDFDGAGDDDDHDVVSGDELAPYLKEMEEQYGSVSEKHKTKHPLKIRLITDDEIPPEKQTDEEEMSDKGGDNTEEDEVAESDVDTKRRHFGNLRSDIDHMELRFMEVNGEPRPVMYDEALSGRSSVIDDIKGVTFLEIGSRNDDLHTESEYLRSSDDEASLTNGLLRAKRTGKGGTTDIEDFSDDELERPVTPTPPDDELDTDLPEPARKLILVSEDQEGRPVSVVMPLSDNYVGGLFNKLDVGGVTDVEDYAASGDEAGEMSPKAESPELPEHDESVVEATECVKTEKKKKQGRNILETLTDSEDIFLDEGKEGRRRRARNKAPEKMGDFLAVEGAGSRGGTDVEDLELSDGEGSRGLEIIRPEPEGGLDVSFEEKTDVEDIVASTAEESDGDERELSVTPYAMREMVGERVIFKEGDGEIIVRDIEWHEEESSVDEDENHDTELDDVIASSEETGTIRDVLTPIGFKFTLDEGSESSVHIQHTSKMDYDTAEEAVHLKEFVDLRESHTDIEDVDEDGGQSFGSRQKTFESTDASDHISVVEDSTNTCVCVSIGNSNMCVCVGKTYGELSLWNESRNSSWPLDSDDEPEGNSEKLEKTPWKTPIDTSIKLDQSSLSSNKMRVSARNPVDKCLHVCSSTLQDVTEKKVFETVVSYDIVGPGISQYYIPFPKTLELPTKAVGFSRMKAKIKDRSLSESILLKKPLESEGDLKEVKCNSVSKLIQRFECLTTSIEKNETSNSEESDKEDEEFVPYKTVMEMNQENFFKPIVQFECLKDRSISPRRLEPKSVQTLPAFQVLSGTLSLTVINQESQNPKNGNYTSVPIKDRLTLFENMANPKLARQASFEQTKKPKSCVRTLSLGPTLEKTHLTQIFPPKDEILKLKKPNEMGKRMKIKAQEVEEPVLKTSAKNKDCNKKPVIVSEKTKPNTKGSKHLPYCGLSEEEQRAAVELLAILDADRSFGLYVSRRRRSMEEPWPDMPPLKPKGNGKGDGNGMGILK